MTIDPVTLAREQLDAAIEQACQTRGDLHEVDLSDTASSAAWQSRCRAAADACTAAIEAYARAIRTACTPRSRG